MRKVGESLPFYAANAVDEVWVIEREDRRVRIFHLEDGGYVDADRSVILDIDAEALRASIDWP